MTDGFDESNGFSRSDVKTYRIPEGTVSGVITNVKKSPKGDINFGIKLDENEGIFMLEVDSDGNTTETDKDVNGEYLNYSIFLPRAEHKSKTTNGGQNAYQWRVNNFFREVDNLELNIDSEEQAWEAVSEGEWIGLEVTAKVKHEEYNGKVSAKIPLNKLTRRSA